MTQYHLSCNKCDYNYWSSDGFPNYCPHCGQPFDKKPAMCSFYIKYINSEGTEFGLCYGRKNIEKCDCYGNPINCTFY